MSSSIDGMAGCYNTSSRPQMVAVKLSLPSVQLAVEILDISLPSGPLIICDYGSSYGQNTIHAMKMIIDCLRKSKYANHNCLIVHNDLPTNDWKQLFQSLNDDKTYWGLASGRSFYDSCLPPNSVTVGFCSSSLHWLSSKPCNISKHCSSLFSDNNEIEIFKEQARIDLSNFLRHRSRELIAGGVLILSIICMDDEGSCGSNAAKNLLYKCAQSIPLTSDELLNYTIPEHLRSYSECLDVDLFRQCNLMLVNSEFCLVKSELFFEWENNEVDVDHFAREHTKFMCSWSESALRRALEISGARAKHEVDELLNQFWTMYEQEVKARPYEHDSRSYRTYLVLKKMAIQNTFPV